LDQQGKQLMSVSPSRGSGPAGMNLEERKEKIEREFSEHGIGEVNFTPDGPDIVAVSENPSEVWKIECKGYGSGKPSTQENNFHRLIATMVRHFEGKNIDNKEVIIGVAFPSNNRKFVDLTVKYLSAELFEALNLRVMIYDPETGNVEVIVSRGCPYDYQV